MPSHTFSKIDPDSLPTRGQLKTLRVFHKLQKKLGRAPTLNEVSEEMGFTENGAQRHLAALVERGLLTPPEVQRIRIQDITPAGLKWV